MRIRIALVFIVLLANMLLSAPAFADNLFVDYGLGFMHSSGSQFLELRYQHDTSKLFGKPSFYEWLVDYWTNDFSSTGFGVVRGVRWTRGTEHYLSTSFGIMGISHTTKHLGTRYQFHFRLAYNFKAAGSNLAFAFTHISNGKLLFGWDGPNMGENFISLSVGFF